MAAVLSGACPETIENVEANFRIAVIFVGETRAAANPYPATGQTFVLNSCLALVFVFPSVRSL